MQGFVEDPWAWILGVQVENLMKIFLKEVLVISPGVGLCT